MKNTFEPVDHNGSYCGNCSSTGCNTFDSIHSKPEQHSLITRRSFGQTLIAASAGALFFSCAESAKNASDVIGKSDSLSSGFSPGPEVAQKPKGPILTVLDEFYKIGPGPSSSHTMGPMRITYDFFQRISKLPEDQLKRATSLKVHLFGSLSATGKGHGTDRASLAGLLVNLRLLAHPNFSMPWLQTLKKYIR